MSAPASLGVGLATLISVNTTAWVGKTHTRPPGAKRTPSVQRSVIKLTMIAQVHPRRSARDLRIHQHGIQSTYRSKDEETGLGEAFPERRAEKEKDHETRDGNAETRGQNREARHQNREARHQDTQARDQGDETRDPGDEASATGYSEEDRSLRAQTSRAPGPEEVVSRQSSSLGSAESARQRELDGETRAHTSCTSGSFDHGAESCTCCQSTC